MTRRNRLLIGAAVASVCLLAPRSPASQDEPPTVVTVKPLSSDIVLPAEQLAILQGAAIGGSLEASERVLDHWTQQNDDRELLYWAQIAAENGSVGGQKMYALLLAESKAARDRDRAAFWRNRVKQAAR